MIPAGGWVGSEDIIVSPPLEMLLPVPVSGNYREPTPLDPVAELHSFPFTARMEGDHEVVTVAGLDADDAFTTQTTLSLLEVFGAVLVDILFLGTRTLDVAPSPASVWAEQNAGDRPVSVLVEEGPRPATVWDEQ